MQQLAQKHFCVLTGMQWWHLLQYCGGAQHSVLLKVEGKNSLHEVTVPLSLYEFHNHDHNLVK